MIVKAIKFIKNYHVLECRFGVLKLTLLNLLIFLLAGFLSPAYPAVRIFKNCTELNKVYPGGVALPGAVNKGGKTKLLPKFEKSIYLANKKSDRDGDGIACEK